MNSSEAPRLARPISCEKSAKSESASNGTWPSNSWQTSGSGVYSGRELQLKKIRICKSEIIFNF